MARIVIDNDGTKSYHDDNYNSHRDDGPAYIKKSGTMWWYTNGIQSSHTHPCDRNSNGAMLWYVNDALNRISGPCIDKPNGYKYWNDDTDGNIGWPKLK